jgi:hypothetical protein
MAPQQYVSDELTHFVGQALPGAEEQFRLLIHILETHSLQASYRVEFGAGSYLRADSSKKLSSNAAVRAATVCFCDIPVAYMAIHMNKYSRFGIAFDKRFLMRHGASPAFYVAANAAPPPSPGIGPRSLGEKFDALYQDLYTLIQGTDELVDSLSPRRSGGARFTFKFSPKGTPPELQVLGKLNAFASDLEAVLFAHLKFFDGRLPEDHIDNHYMEREWRKVDGLCFQWENVARIILPDRFVPLLHERLPDFDRPVTRIAEDGSVMPITGSI